MLQIKKSRSGFTLTELIIVVAILAIVAAIAIPALFSFQKNLQMTEVNNAARSIFIAAQNRMSELSAAGRLGDLQGTAMSQKPSDFPDGPDADAPLTWDASAYFYLTKAQTDFLLPAGAIEEETGLGYYYIEYNAKTGMVYGVFYAHSPFTYSAALPRDAGERGDHDPLLGYYGGADVSYEDWDAALAPPFELLNDETLRVVLETDLAFTDRHYTVTITDTEGSAVTYDLDDYMTYDNITCLHGVYTIYLDSLEEGGQFQDLFPDLIPGSDLTVTVRVLVDGFFPGTSRQIASSLFAAATEEAITVTHARHLQNLSVPFSGLAESAAATHVLIGGDIDWADAQIDDFTTIENEWIITLDGGGSTLSNFNAPLFGTFANPEGAMSNVTVKNPYIQSGESSVGALVNYAGNAAFVNCVLWADDEASGIQVQTVSAAGGLVGLAQDCTFSACSASLPHIRQTAAATSSATGGLVGILYGGSITRSYAATGWWDTEEAAWKNTEGIHTTNGYAGGLVGGMSAGTVSYSYATGNIVSASGIAGGLTAYSADGTQYSYSYSAVTFQGTGENAAIFGFSPAAIPANCYYLKAAVGATADAAALSYAELAACLSGTNWQAASTDTTTSYGRAANQASPVYPFPRLAGMMHYGDWPEETRQALGILYYEKYADGVYAYHIEGHTRNLRADTDASSTVAEDGYVILAADEGDGPSYTWGTGKTPGTYQNSGSAMDQITILEDGEAVIYNVYLMDIAPITASDAPVFYTRVDVGSDTYWFNPSFAQTEVNTHVSTVTQPAPSLPDFITIRTARHLSALSQTAYANKGYWSMAYRQTLNIDFSAYAAAHTLYPIGSVALGIPFTGVYQGTGHFIEGITLSGLTASTQGAGLFGHVSGGTLSDIIFVGTGTTPIVGGQFVGGLVGYMDGGSISGCMASGFHISASGSTAKYVGGLVGLLTGGATIDRSTAGHYTTPDNESGADGGHVSLTGSAEPRTVNGVAYYTVGGLVGCVSNATVTNSSAIVTLISQNTANGFAGCVENGGRLTDCYSIALDANQNIYTAMCNTPATYTSGCMVFDGTNFGQIRSTYAHWGMPNALNTRPYAASRASQAFPYPAPVKNAQGSPIHVGNWPNSTELIKGVLYYERYADGALGLYGSYLAADNITASVNTLSNGKTVTGDGYAIIIHKSSPYITTDTPAYAWGGSGTNGGYLNASAPEAVTVTQGDVNYYYDVYYMNLSPITTESSASTFYTSVTISSVQCWMNPSFAKANVNNAASRPASPGTVYLRTARHLSRLSSLTGYWAKTYYQELDINFTTYTSSAQTLTRIGTGSSAFSGTYDGGYHVITGASISGTTSSTDYVGLFGYNTGTIRNTFFISDQGVTRTIVGSDCVGGFVGQNAGTITNCASAGFSITASPTGFLSVYNNHVGGFVGYNTGTITNCSAAQAQMGYTYGGIINAGNKCNSGAFVGRNDKNISSCYGVNTRNHNPGASVGRDGAFVGYNNAGGISNSYCISISGSSYMTNFQDNTTMGSGTQSNTYCYSGTTASATSISNGLSGVGGFSPAGTTVLTYSYGTAGTYPFPAVVKNADGNYVHYGNWQT